MPPFETAVGRVGLSICFDVSEGVMHIDGLLVVMDNDRADSCVSPRSVLR